MKEQFYVGVTSDGRVYIQDEDFEYDARLYINGDFVDTSITVKYAEKICDKLNMSSKSNYFKEQL